MDSVMGRIVLIIVMNGVENEQVPRKRLAEHQPTQERQQE